MPAITRGAARPAPAASKAAGGRARLAPYVFLAPGMLLFGVTLAAPILYAVYLSLRKVQTKGLGLLPGSRTETWAGLRNYRNALTDSDFLHSVVRVIGYGAVVVPVMLGLALLFALLLDSKRARARTFSRTTIFMPYAVPAVIASLLWGFLYLPSVSPFSRLLSGAGMGFPDLLSSKLVLFSVANIAIWGGTGFNMIVIYTALRAIPSEFYEAARLDGAGEIAIALRIKIPIVTPSIVMTAIFSLIATLQVFAEPMTLKPLSNTISSTWTPLMKVYRDAFTRGDIYSASATSVVIAIATFVVSFGVLRLVGSRAFEEGRR